MAAGSPLNGYDLCIVGAGVAGLNALAVASRYLTSGQRVALIDRRPEVGGMWVDTYDYVRLHQPHPLFTAGNIEWTLDQPREYLPTKSEVLDHFRHCVEVVQQDLEVDEFLGWDVEGAAEDGGTVRISCTSNDGRRRVLEADKLIKAPGFNIQTKEPLHVSSSFVRSVSPDHCDVRSAEMRDSDAPVWIIGGGKTAMDTAHTLVTSCPGREVNLVAGSGTFFSRREEIFPPGRECWYRGQRPNAVLADLALEFDGTNEDDVLERGYEMVGTRLTPASRNFRLGILSEAENAVIRCGLREVVMDHFVDVVDRDGSPRIVLRSGETRRIPAGSWIVNCTGYIVPQEDSYEPYVSESGAITVVSTRSAIMLFSSFCAYFATQLLMLGKIRDVPLYAVDADDLLSKSKTAFVPTLVALSQYNLGLIFDAVPQKVFTECGLDVDRWYPLPRRLVGQLQFVRNHKREREHHRRSLDTVRERFDVRCGPVVG